jgi:hypothetical protein
MERIVAEADGDDAGFRESIFFDVKDEDRIVGS